MPPRPFTMNPVQHIVQIIFLTMCYLWLSVCCFIVAPSEDETLHRYLERLRIPHSFTAQYILPLISSVATCSYEALLQTPAHDFVTYKKKLYKADHYTVDNGVWAVERKLLRGIDVQLGCEIEEVKPIQGGLRLRWRDPRGHHMDVFENIILAVSPNVIARIFTPLRDIMSQIPTVDVHSCIIQPRDQRPRLLVAEASQNLHIHVRCDKSSTRFLSLRSHSDWTVTYQRLRSGAFVVTNTKEEEFEHDSVLTKTRFTRVLRTVESRKLVNEIFRENNSLSKTKWRNGDSGVWIAGAWCWDGMVLLEGCVVSAMRIAEAFDVEVPWKLACKKNRNIYDQ
jgi:predicted NAD/FAD-binding protein